MNKNSVIDWSLIIAIGIAWGSSFLFIKISAPEVGPITLVFSRLLIASMLLTLSLLQESTLETLKKIFSSILFLALINASVPFYLFLKQPSN